MTCIYSESSQPSWIQRVDKIAKNNRNHLPTPSLISEGPSSTRPASSPVQADEPRNIPRSPSPSYRTSLTEEPTETNHSPLHWYHFTRLACYPTIELTISRLTSRHLPNPWKIGLLVEEYFNNIHPLRCFSFIHRPSFLQRLDKEVPKKYQNHALLHIICALGGQSVEMS